MPEEQTQVPEGQEPEGTPEETTGAPTEGTSEDQSQVDWPKRYDDLRAEFNRDKQRLAEYEQFLDTLRDPESQPEALEALGFQLAEDDEQEDEEEFKDPYEERLLALEETLSERSEQEQEQQLVEAEDAFISQQIDTISGSKSQEFSDEEIQLIGDLSQVMRDDKGLPDVGAAYERIYGQLLPQKTQEYLKSKRAARPGSGQSAEHKPNLDNERERVEHMAQRLQEGEL
jgi:hypothetical protein